MYIPVTDWVPVLSAEGTAIRIRIFTGDGVARFRWEVGTNFPYHRFWWMNVIRRITSKILMTVLATQFASIIRENQLHQIHTVFFGGMAAATRICFCTNVSKDFGTDTNSDRNIRTARLRQYYWSNLQVCWARKYNSCNWLLSIWRQCRLFSSTKRNTAFFFFFFFFFLNFNCNAFTYANYFWRGRIQKQITETV